MRMVSMATRDEVMAALAGRYGEANRQNRGRILGELVAQTGDYRKRAFSATRAAF